MLSNDLHVLPGVLPGVPPLSFSKWFTEELLLFRTNLGLEGKVLKFNFLGFTWAQLDKDLNRRFSYSSWSYPWFVSFLKWVVLGGFVRIIGGL